MTTELIIHMVLTFGAGVIGVAVGWGGMRFQIRRNTKDIATLRKDFNSITGTPAGIPVYMRREECQMHNGDVAYLKRAVGSLQNVARWLLVNKEKMDLAEANELLGER